MYRISLPQPHYCSRLMSAAQMDEGRDGASGIRNATSTGNLVEKEGALARRAVCTQGFKRIFDQ